MNGPMIVFAAASSSSRFRFLFFFLNLFFNFETEFPVDQDGLELFHVTGGDLDLPIFPSPPPLHHHDQTPDSFSEGKDHVCTVIDSRQDLLNGLL